MNLIEMIGQERIDKGMWWSKDCGLQLVEGCTKVSPGCDNCWSLTAANMRRFNPNPKTAARYEGTVWKNPGLPPYWTGQVNPQWDDLDKIGRSRTPKVYTFWNDLFHPGVGPNFQNNVMFRIKEHPEHFFIICTKRPGRALEYFTGQYALGGSPFQNASFIKNLMLMTTAENQEMADLRLPVLLQIPGVMHGVSVEPGLEVVNLNPYLRPNPGCSFVNPEDGTCDHPDTPDPECHIGSWCAPVNHEYRGLDWVVCGGESGPNARPMHPDIPRKLRDDCVAAGVPFFFKSWGKWAPGSDASVKNLCVYNDGRTVEFTREAILAEEKRSGLAHNDFAPTLMSRVGKKTAGRALDGRTWDEVPI